jgi:dihydroflavonol-4-reductase
MNRVLLTGATGFIGGHVAWSLVQRGYEVVALNRPARKMTWWHDSLTVRTGDILNQASVRAAIDGCDAVVHCAANYALWSRDPSTIYAANVEGTRNVLEAAIDAGVERIVYTSTVGTTRFRRDAPATESDLAGPQGMAGHYKRSKYEAERIALRLARSGAPIVIVNPTAPVGSADVKPTPTGRIIVDFLRGRLPAFVDTGLNFVGVDDVAEGHVLALEKGTPGERYLLGSADGNLTLAELLIRLSKITGLPAPRWRIPHAIARLMASVDGYVEGDLLHREPRIPMEGVRMAHQKMWADPSKAIRDLGMPQHSVNEALAQSIAWFVQHGYAPAPPGYPSSGSRGRTRQRRRQERVS